MKQTFFYQEKFSFSYFYPFIAFAILAGLAKYFHYGLQFKRLTILEYPYSFYSAIVLAALFLAYAIYKYMQTSKQNQIEMDDTSFRFPKGTGKKIRIVYDEITELRNKKNDDYSRQAIIFTKENKIYELSESYFANSEEFNQFYSHLVFQCFVKGRKTMETSR